MVYNWQIEQQRTDELLKQMLPRTVVNALKQKRTVEPEYFNCVTIYFRWFIVIRTNSNNIYLVAIHSRYEYI